MRRSLVAVAVVLVVGSSSRDASAIRPFITDDARTVGRGRLQLETYWRRDKNTIQHWLLPAFGPTEWLELTLGGVHGFSGLREYERGPRYSFAGPLVQAKVLLRETVPNRLPGFAVAVGGASPLGAGGFQPPGWSGFSYLAMSQSFIKEDDFLIHANVGVATVSADGIDPAKLTWGVGTQVETIYNVHLIGEIFSGDPYAQRAGGSFQAGFRIIFNDWLQLDATAGSGLWGPSDSRLPTWLSSGIRIVSNPLF